MDVSAQEQDLSAVLVISKIGFLPLGEKNSTRGTENCSKWQSFIQGKSTSEEDSAGQLE